MAQVIPDPKKIIEVIQYEHPVFTPDAIVSQERWSEISGTDRIHYCGAYWRWGFHEDGVWSALRVSEALGGRGPIAAEGTESTATPVPLPLGEPEPDTLPLAA